MPRETSLPPEKATEARSLVELRTKPESTCESRCGDHHTNQTATKGERRADNHTSKEEKRTEKRIGSRMFSLNWTGAHH